MMKKFFLALVPAAVLLMACAVPAPDPAEAEGENDNHAHSHDHGPGNSDVTRAVCVLVAVGDNKVQGTLYFDQEGDKIHLHGEVTGLTPGKHGFHVHQWGDLTDTQEGMSAGGHFNPSEKPHGKPADQERHVGDLGNIEADESGKAVVDITDSMLTFGGPHSIIGRSMMVHAGEDVFTQPVGDAGARVAFGVIGVAAPQEE